MKLDKKDYSIDALRADVEMRDLAERGTDLDNAAFFVRRARGKVRYNFTARQWMFHDGKRWRFDQTGYVMQLAKDVAREAVRLAAELKEDDLRLKAIKHTVRMQSRKGLEAMIFLAQSDLPVAADAFNTDPYAYNTLTGTFDLRELVLRPHNPNDLITKLAPVEYDPDATCPRWTQFIYEVMQGDDELIDSLQRFIGLCMTGVVVDHLFAVLYGSGSNGKTTLLDILGEILGDYAAVCDPALFTAQHNSQGPSPELVRLNGMRFVHAAELPEGARFAEGRMKRLTGGDAVAARDLFSGVIEMKPTWKIAIATNHRPVVKDATEGFWRRVRLIPFEAVFTGTRKDERLREKLLAEKAGILNWCIEGCIKWQESGLGEATKIETATSAYRAESDLLGAFIAENCVVAEHARVRGSALYAAFANWAKDAGERPIPNARAFHAALRDRGHHEARAHGVKYTTGLGLRADRDDDRVPEVPEKSQSFSRHPYAGDFGEKQAPEAPDVSRMCSTCKRIALCRELDGVFVCERCA